MALTKEEVLKVAKLARLELKPEEIEKYQVELNEILNYIDMLDNLDTNNTEALTQINNNTNNLREDEVRPSLLTKDVLKNSPESVDGTIIVPKVVGGENN